MFTKTKAIILSCRKYKENALILQMYTAEFGRSSYILYGSQSKKKGRKLSFLQPLSIVIVDAEHQPKRELQQIKEIKSDYPHTNLLFDPYKSSIALFLSEVLLHILRTNEKDESLFSFLQQSIRYLDLTEKGIANFHITFLIRLTLFLGIKPNPENISKNLFFDLKQGVYTTEKPIYKYYLTPKESILLTKIIRINYNNMHLFKFKRQDRTEILERILSYYKLHLQEFGEIHSFTILKEVFN